MKKKDFQEQKKFVQGTIFVRFFMYCKAKKIRSNPKNCENFYFSKNIK